jgi:hypothetical protein
MAVEMNADEYRKKADEMKAQASRAETVYLQAIYASIADNWDRLAEQMRAAERKGKKDRATENWEKLAADIAGDAETEPQRPPPSAAKGGSQNQLPRR